MNPEDKTTITDNEVIALIAEFMGLDIDGQNVTDGQQETTIDRLKYSTSWEWLMPVVEKIESLGCEVRIYTGHTTITKNGFPICQILGEDKKQVTYEAVLKAIRWYNSTQTKSSHDTESY